LIRFTAKFEFKSTSMAAGVDTGVRIKFGALLTTIV